MSTTPRPNEQVGRYVLVHGGWMMEPVRPSHLSDIAELIGESPLVVVHDVMEISKLSSNTVAKALLALDYVQLNDGATLVDSTWEKNPEVRATVRFRPRRNGTYLKTREALRREQERLAAEGQVVADAIVPEPADEPGEDEPTDLVVADDDTWPLDVSHIDLAATTLQQVQNMAKTMGLTIEIRVRRTPVTA